MKIKKTYIYILKDPTTNKIRYVGKSNNPKSRYSKHIKDSEKHKCNSHKENWIRKLLRENKKPILEIVESVNYDKWKEKEREWIFNLKKQGVELTNSTEGGDSENTKLCKKVAKINYVTEEILEIYNSLADAAYYNNLKSYTRILSCCKGKNLRSGRFKWRYVNENGDIIEPGIDKEFKSKRVAKLNLNLEIIEVYETLYEVRNHGYDFANISHVCKGDYKMVYNYIWRYLDKKGDIINPKIKYKHKTVSQLSLNGKILNIFENCERAAESIDVSGSNITLCCRNKRETSGGYKWAFNNY